MSSPDKWTFAEFEVDIANQELRLSGVAVKLAPQPFKVLLLLIERRGTLVRREELRQAVWGNDTIVDFEHGLNTCIRQIRHALGDDRAGARFIETIPRLGYRFIAETHPAVPVEIFPVAPQSVPAILSARGVLSRRAAWAALLAVFALTVAGWFVVRMGLHASAVRSDAHDLYLRGRLALDDATPGSARTALELFERALEDDAAYAPAHTGIAEVYLQKPTSILNVPPDVATARAHASVERALRLDGALPEAQIAAATLHMTERDWPAAGRDYRRAIDLAPGHSLAHRQYALWLSYQERFEDALKEARLGESFDPLSPAAANNVAEVFRHARRFDEAIAQAQHVLALNPNFGRAHAVMAQCYLGQGRPDLAIDEFQRSGTFNGTLGFAYATAGRIAEARQLVETLERRYQSTRGGSGEIGQIYIALHEFDRAFEWLSRAVDDGALWTLRVAVVFDPIRSDPRFADLVQRSGYGE